MQVKGPHGCRQNQADRARKAPKEFFSAAPKDTASSSISDLRIWQRLEPPSISSPGNLKHENLMPARDGTTACGKFRTRSRTLPSWSNGTWQRPRQCNYARASMGAVRRERLSMTQKRQSIIHSLFDELVQPRRSRNLIFGSMTRICA